MSQKIVYEILKELGGKATIRQIQEFAHEKYPELTLHLYVGDRLKKLEKWGYIKKNPDGSWEITSVTGPLT